ncbi:MAG: transporter substrate-binding domain-containing protein [Treponema sp.]|nr:transporter substrate-binding domain-containing protein [Treponema sp.]
MKKTIIRAVAAAVVASILGGAAFAAKKQKIKTVYVGVGYESDFSYLNEKGELAGYEIDMLKAIDEALPQYEFKYETSDLKGILLGLSAGKFDIGLKQYESNDERRKNYLFSENGYLCYDSYIQVLSSRNDINSLEDLQGKTVIGGSTVGAAMGTKLENLNKNLPDDKKYKVVYAKMTAEELIASLKNGSIDASTSTKALFRKRVQQYGDVVKLVGKEPVRKSDAYVLFNKKQTQLKKDFDAVLNDLIKTGKLSEISVKALGYDYKDN